MRLSTASTTATSVRTVTSQVSTSVLSSGRSPVVGVTYRSTSTGIPTLKVPPSMVTSNRPSSIITSALENAQTSPAPKSSSRSASEVKPLPLFGNLAPSLTQRRRDNGWSESIMNTETDAFGVLTRQASFIANLESGADPTPLSSTYGSPGPANTRIRLPSVTQYPVVIVDTTEAQADNHLDNTSESSKATISNGVDFPATENFDAINFRITSAEHYILRYSSTNAEIANPVADALSTMRDEYNSIIEWCRSYNTQGAASSIYSYCALEGARDTRRDVVPSITFSNSDHAQTTLVTKCISITNIVTLTSTTSISTANSTHSSQSTKTSPSATSFSKSFQKLNRRKNWLEVWGVTNHHHPAEIGNSILRLPPHQGDCVRRPRTCATLLSLIGALCGIPFGMILFVLFRACFRCCAKWREDKKEEQKYKEQSKKWKLESDEFRQWARDYFATARGKWAHGGPGLRGRGRRGSGETIEMGPDNYRK